MLATRNAKVCVFISKVQKTGKTEQKKAQKKTVAFSAVLKRPLKDLYSRSWGGREVVFAATWLTPG